MHAFSPASSQRTSCLLFSPEQIGGDGVLSTEDIVVGALMGLFLAFTASLLQGSRSQNDFLLWGKTDDSSSPISLSANTADPTSIARLNEENRQNGNNADAEEEKGSLVFDGDDWREMSRPENYIFYNRKLKKSTNSSEIDGPKNNEKALVIVALLTLFVPIFSIEFFFALSRQVLCGAGSNGILSTLEFAQYLCSPV
jgi:hypothetical protein